MKNGIAAWASRLGLCAAVVFAAGACLDLDIVNENDPDRKRALESPGDIEALIAGGFINWYDVETYYYPAGAMSVAADAHSSSWGNFGMRDAGWEPRKAFDNDAAYSYNDVAELPWLWSYRPLAGIRDGLLAIRNDREKMDRALGEDNTERLLVFGKLVQALSLASLAVIFDRAFVVDEDTDLGNLGLVEYTEVWKAAEAKFGEVISMSQGASWQIPSIWVGCNGDWSSAYTAEIARTYRARYASQVARTEAERASLDWAAIKADAAPGISKHFAGYYDTCTWAWHGTKWLLAIHAGWGRLDYRTIGPSDASGEWEKWINAAPDDKRPFNIDTDDRRITGGTPDSDGMYIKYMGNSPFPADRGIYHYSNYIDWRWRYIYDANFVAEWPDMTAKELDFLAAEANFRLGNKDAAMAIVNKYRTTNGQLPAFTSVDGVAPGGDRCVPQNADGSCGNLWEALKYEKRIELFHYGMGTEYFDDRGWGDLVTNTWLQLPIPASELEILLQEVYTFGGPGGGSAAPDFINDISPDALRAKVRAIDLWRETHRERINDVGVRRN
jgi:hypothetical protein